MSDPFVCSAGQSIAPTASTEIFPAVFVSHGAPTLMLEESPARAFLRHLGSKLGTPRAIIVVSAHWIAPEFRVTVAPRLHAEYDFTGFPAELYQIEYSPPGAVDVANEIVDRISAAGLTTLPDTADRIDHGTWVPLKLMYPRADVPVTQVSLQARLDAREHARVGRALSALRAQGCLILGSGGLVHNIRDWFADRREGSPPYEAEFANRIDAYTAAGEFDALLDAAGTNDGRRAHPTLEHWLPLIVAAFASDESSSGTVRKSRRIFDGGAYEEPRMNAYAFG
jgi:4,5-DOPA dioxygenase extradiol